MSNWDRFSFQANENKTKRKVKEMGVNWKKKRFLVISHFYFKFAPKYILYKNNLVQRK